jgi:copper transport protein
MSTRSSRSWLLAVLIAISVAPSLALAHPRLKRSAPGAGERLSVVPTELRLWFTETPELAMTTIMLTDSAGNVVAIDPVERDTSALGVRAVIRRRLEPGSYTVTWRTAAADGHPTRGRFSFTLVAAPAMTPPVPAQAPTRPSVSGENRDSLESVAATPLEPRHVIVRAITFTCLLLIIGIVVFRFAVLNRAMPGSRLHALIGNRAATLGIIASLTLILAAAGRLALQRTMINMSSGLHLSAGDIVTTTHWGAIWLLQVGLAVLAAAALLRVRVSRSAWSLAAVAAIGLAATPALAGHAATSPRLTTLSVLADSLHVLGAAGWLGSLLVLVTVAIPIVARDSSEDRWQSVSSLVHTFSPTALAFAALIGLTGLITAWLRVGTFSALWNSGYGRMLLLKLAVLLPLAATGAYNCQRIRPALGSERATGRLRRVATIELLVAFIVICITSVLVATEPPVR